MKICIVRHDLLKYHKQPNSVTKMMINDKSPAIFIVKKQFFKICKSVREVTRVWDHVFLVAPTLTDLRKFTKSLPDELRQAQTSAQLCDVFFFYLRRFFSLRYLRMFLKVFSSSRSASSHPTVSTQTGAESSWMSRMRWQCLVTRSVPLPDLVTTPVYFVTVELLPAPVDPTQIMQLFSKLSPYPASRDDSFVIKSDNFSLDTRHLFLGSSCVGTNTGLWSIFVLLLG